MKLTLNFGNENFSVATSRVRPITALALKDQEREIHVQVSSYFLLENSRGNHTELKLVC